jgi:hypothetical protein
VGQDFIPGAGAQFRLSRDLWMVVIRESPRESSIWCVGQVLPMRGVYRFESSLHSRLWVATCCCSHLVVCLVYYWCIRGVGYGYGYDYIIIMIIELTYLWRWHGLTFCLFVHALVCRCKHSNWLNLIGVDRCWGQCFWVWCRLCIIDSIRFRLPFKFRCMNSDVSNSNI